MLFLFLLGLFSIPNELSDTRPLPPHVASMTSIKLRQNIEGLKEWQQMHVWLLEAFVAIMQYKVNMITQPNFPNPTPNLLIRYQQRFPRLPHSNINNNPSLLQHSEVSNIDFTLTISFFQMLVHDFLYDFD